MAGFEKTFNGEGILQQIMKQFAARMKGGSMGGGEPMEVPVTLKLSMSPEQSAVEDLNRIQGQDVHKRFSQTDPTAQRRWSWDNPNDHENPDVVAQKRWSQLQAMGPLGTLRGIGSLNEKWGGYLQGDAGYQGWMGAAAKSGDASRYSSAMEGMEKAGGKMAELMRELDNAGQGSGRSKAVASDIRALADSIENLKQQALGAAHAIGGPQGAALEQGPVDLAAAAAGGQVSSGGGGGSLLGGVGPRGVMNLIRNPMGFISSMMQNGMGQALLRSGLGRALAAPTLMGEGGALGELGGLGSVALPAAALAGGALAGWHFDKSQAGDAYRDSQRFMGDYQFSRGMGNGFDYRGMTWNSSRTGFSSNWAMDGMNPIAAQRALSGMGISAGGWNGGNEDMLMTGNRMAYGAMTMGVDPDTLSGFMGNSVRSGIVKRDSTSVGVQLSRIGDLLEISKDAGVSVNEKMGVLVSIRQHAELSMGYGTAGSVKGIENLSSNFDATKDPSLMGQAGARVIGAITGNQDKRFLAYGMNSILSNGRLNAKGVEAAERILGKSVKDLHALRMTDFDIAQDVVNSDEFKIEEAEGAQSGPLGSMSNFNMQNFLHMGSLSHTQAATALSVMRKGGSLKMAQSAVRDLKTTQSDDEADKRFSTIGLTEMSQQVLETTRNLKDLNNILRNMVTINDVGGSIKSSAWEVGMHPIANMPKGPVGHALMEMGPYGTAVAYELEVLKRALGGQAAPASRK